MDRREFFSELFRDVENGWVTFGHHYTNRSGEQKYKPKFVRIEDLPDESPGKNCYFSLGYLAKKIEEIGRRGTKEDIVGLTCLWMDIDFIKDGKEDKNYPPREVALEALDQMPLKATVVNDTGGGAHAYWFLNDTYEPSHVIQIGRAWRRLLSQKIEPYQLDPDGNVVETGVLRIPGTTNAKYGVMVDAISHDFSRRYFLDDFEAFVLIEPPQESGPLIGDVTPADIMAEFATLLSNSTEFRNTWEHRKRFASCSEAEMSLANFAVMSGWTDGQIASLIIAHRRKWEPEKISKVERKDYLEGTIRRARSGQEKDDVQEVIDRHEAEQAIEKIADMPPENARMARLRALSDRLGFDVARVVQYGRESSTAVIELVCADGRKIDLGKVCNIIKHATLREKLLVEQKILLGIEKSDQAWGNFVSAVILPVLEVEDFEEYEIATSVAGMIEQYIAEYDRFRDLFSCVGDRVRDKKPVPQENGTYAINLNAFSDWVARRTKDRMTTTALGRVVRGLGWVKKQINGRDSSGKQRNNNYWEPPDVFCTLDTTGEDFEVAEEKFSNGV